MTGDFNIRDSIWDPNFSHHSTHSDLLIDIADSMNFCLLSPTNQFPTRYLDNHNDSNLVIDLMFLRQDSLELDNYMIHPDWRLSSDHAPLTVNIMIMKEHVQTKKYTLVKNSKKKKKSSLKI